MVESRWWINRTIEDVNILSLMCSVSATERRKPLSMDGAMADEGHHVADIRITCTLMLRAESRV